MLKRKTVVQIAKGSEDKISLDNCYAKTYLSNDMSKLDYGKTVDCHCKIVGNIAKVLLHDFCTKRVANLFPKNSSLIVAVHDLGKISPTFQLKLAKAIDRISWKKSHPELVPYELIQESSFGGHPTVSYSALKNINENVALIAGQHHGALHPIAYLKNEHSDDFGGSYWNNLRKREYLNLCNFFEMNLDARLSPAQLSLLSGLTCVSDWIGSGSYFDDPSSDVEKNIKESVLGAGFRKFKIKKNLTFKDIFGFSSNETQDTLLKDITSPGVYVVEAPMGLGKTELALYAAYKLLVTEQASGIYFALPTQLTSNKIWTRVSDFLSKVIEGTNAEKRSLLLHSTAHLVQDSLGADAMPGKSWFSSAKRGLLYPFAVGTIDQALLSVMNVRHSFVRSFGLAGKVVIIDEVHTYDCYTGSILDSLVQHLINIGCSVIILSATLSVQRRSELLKRKSETSSYPVMSYVNSNSEELRKTVVIKPVPDRNINLAFKSYSDCRREVIKRAKDGQQILWIENTVEDAQSTYMDIAYLAKNNGIECGLIHSRFTPIDRERKESYWVELLGKNTSSELRSKNGRILIGTQVLEQSLDIDADFLVSRFAPTDMLLQRIGRLWRHCSTARSESAKPDMWMVDAELKECIDSDGSALAPSSYVYSPYVLCRSLEVFKRQADTGSISIPSDIRRLIDETYIRRDEKNPHYKNMLQELRFGSKNRKGIESLKSLARSAVAERGVVISDENAPTRYASESQSKILIASDISCNNDKTEIEFLDGNKCEILKKCDRKSSGTRKISIELMKHIVQCQQTKSPSQITKDQAIKLGLENYLYLGDKEDSSAESGLSIMIISSSGVLKNFNGLAEDKYIYTYSYEKGLEVVKKNGN